MSSIFKFEPAVYNCGLCKHWGDCEELAIPPKFEIVDALLFDKTIYIQCKNYEPKKRMVGDGR